MFKNFAYVLNFSFEFIILSTFNNLPLFNLNLGLKHRILAVLLILVVLFPFALQASHALDSHEHVVCTAKDVKHFHDLEFDCSIFHTPVENQSDFFGLEYVILINKKFNQFFIPTEQGLSLGHISLKSSRAPPYFIA